MRKETSPFVLTNSAGKNGIGPAIELLSKNLQEGARQKGSTKRQTLLLNSVETGVRSVEADPEVHSVGSGSWPNMLGELELDAAIMNGTTLECGAVGAVKGYPHPISIARKVMEKLPHVCLVGEGAGRFAAETGMEAEETLTPEVTRKWEEWINDTLSEEENALFPDGDLIRLAWKNADPLTLGTTVLFAGDGRGNIASGVSTSGWSWKYPGRLGDSPIIGAGSYADSRYGAAGCIGHGELSIRTSAARAMVLYMKTGYSVKEACLEAARDVAYAKQGFKASLTLYAVDTNGNHYVAACGPSPEDRYYFWRGGTPAPSEKTPVRIKEWDDVNGIV